MCRFKEIVSTDMVTRPYDIIAVIGGLTEEQLQEFMNDKLRSIIGITRTVLCEAAPLMVQAGGPRDLLLP
jgi:hypothetical protein